MPPLRVILLVDDRPAELDLLARAFAAAGFRGVLRSVPTPAAAQAYLSGAAPYADRSAHPLPGLILAKNARRGKNDRRFFLGRTRTLPQPATLAAAAKLARTLLGKNDRRFFPHPQKTTVVFSEPPEKMTVIFFAAAPAPRRARRGRPRRSAAP